MNYYKVDNANKVNKIALLYPNAKADKLEKVDKVILCNDIKQRRHQSVPGMCLWSLLVIKSTRTSWNHRGWFVQGQTAMMTRQEQLSGMSNRILQMAKMLNKDVEPKAIRTTSCLWFLAGFT